MREGAISQLLHAWGRGDVQARDGLVALVYRELKRKVTRESRTARGRLDRRPMTGRTRGGS